MKLKTFLRPAAELLLALLTTAAILAALFLAGSRLMPSRYDFGSVWESYLAEEENTVDVLFFGSSISYCGVMPAAIYRENGLASFVMAGPAQTPEVMFCYVRQACRTQRPGCVVAEITGAFFGRYTDYSQVNVGYMPFGLNRIRAGLACEDGMFRLAVFPIYDFHSELLAPQPAITALTAEDGRMLCGYTPLDTAEAGLQTADREGLHLPGTDEYERHARALEALVRFCLDEDVPLVCYFSPAKAQIPAAARETLIQRLRAAGCETVWDFTDAGGDLGVDDETDWYDSLHFNCIGAEKFSAALARRLSDLGISPAGNADGELWQQRIDYLFQ